MKPTLPSPHKGTVGSPRFAIGLSTVWDVLSHAIRNFRFHGGVNLAAATAFYAVLSIIPLLALTIGVLGLLFGSNPVIREEVVHAIELFNPHFPMDLLDHATQFNERKYLFGWVGIVTLIWSSSLIFNSIEGAFEIIFRSKKSRHYLVSKLLAFTMIPLGWAVGAGNFVITYFAALVKNNPLIPLERWVPGKLLFSSVFQYLLPFLLLVVFFTIVYKIILTSRITLRHALVGALLFAGLMEITKHLFVWYMSRNAKYHLIYGSLETVVTLVLWVFYLAIVWFFCAELIASYQKRDLILLEKVFLQKRVKQ